MSRKWIYVVAALAGFLLAAAWIVYTVFTSKSSTAAIGLLFIPFYGGVVALAMVAAVFAVFALIDARAGRAPWFGMNTVLALVVVTVFAVFAAAVANYRLALALAADPLSSPEQLQALSGRWIPLGHQQVEEALYSNPAVPAALLAQALASAPRNRIVSLIGAHPNAGIDVLGRIAAGAREYDRVWGVAANPRITPDIATHLADVSARDFPGDLEYKLYQSQVLSRLAGNPATPRAVFDRLAAWPSPEFHLAVAVIYSPHASCEQIRRAGDTERGNDVLKNTAQGQRNKRRCPP